MPSATDTRSRRHDAILATLRSRCVRSQAELAQELEREGLGANQATLSRDLRELGVVKGPDGYTLPDDGDLDPLSRACRDWLLEATPVQNQIVLKTPPGSAQLFAWNLDQQTPQGLVGTIAGDDTILAICPDTRSAARLAANLLRRRPR
jgi:transcriptional regulator of arginine metabolism